MNCPKCNYALEPLATTCPRCAEAERPKPHFPYQVQPESPPMKQPSVPYWTLWITVPIIIFGFFFFKNLFSQPEFRAPATAVSAPVRIAPPVAAAPPLPSQAAPLSGGVMVWVNDDSKIYHQPSSRYYGKTKDGRYLSESAARAAGYRESRNGQ